MINRLVRTERNHIHMTNVSARACAHSTYGEFHFSFLWAHFEFSELSYLCHTFSVVPHSWYGHIRSLTSANSIGYCSFNCCVQSIRIWSAAQFNINSHLCFVSPSKYASANYKMLLYGRNNKRKHTHTHTSTHAADKMCAWKGEWWRWREKYTLAHQQRHTHIRFRMITIMIVINTSLGNRNFFFAF